MGYKQIMKKRPQKTFSIQSNTDDYPSSYNSWYIPWSDVLKREADFEIDYTFIDENFTPFVGMQTHFKYITDDQEVWIIFPEFLDKEGIVMMDKRETPALKGKAEMWIINKDNTEKHKSKLYVGMRAYITFFHRILAEVIVTKINI